jgi:hypothetical protein
VPFGRIGIQNDSHRLHLTLPAAGVAGAVAGVAVQTRASYGWDRYALPAAVADQTTLSQAQQLFENTPLGFFGVYLAGAPNRRDSPWEQYAHTLRDQGWSLIPIYVGLQQGGAGLAHIVPATAAHDGARDGAQAVALTRQGNHFPANSVIYLDMENTDAPPYAAATITYMRAWLNAVTAAHYGAGVYCNYLHAHEVHTTFPRARVWATRGYYNNAPFDPLSATELRPVEMTQPAGAPGNWQFVHDAIAWQWATDAPAALRLYLSTGNPINFGGRNDYDLATTPEPGVVGAGRSKGERRRTVTSVTPAAQNTKGGSNATLTVTLSANAPNPNGQRVLIRSDKPEAIPLATSLRVPPGSRTASITVATVPVAQNVAATLSARCLHQLTGPFPTATVTITG